MFSVLLDALNHKDVKQAKEILEEKQHALILAQLQNCNDKMIAILVQEVEEAAHFYHQIRKEISKQLYKESSK